MGSRGKGTMPVSAHEVEERENTIRNVFRTFDYDSSGSIDKEEFGAIGRAIKGDAWDENSDKCFNRVDKDKSGGIDITEFVEFFRSSNKIMMKQERFDRMVNRYMDGAIRGRAEYYLKQANSTVPEDAPESFKVKQQADAEAEATRQATLYAQKQDRLLKRRGMYHRAADYAKEYASAERSLVRQRRQARAAGNYFAEPEARLMFVIRIRGMCDMHPKTKKILQLLRLRQIHLGVFLRVNKATQEMIKRVEPYLAYGYPSLKATRELIYKRGFGKKKTPGQAQRLPLTDNSVIEEALGEYGINCFEDLVHEIYTVGPHFKEANNFLWPFKLNSAKGGMPKKRLGFNEGGQAGNREKYISNLIFRML